MQNLTTIVIEEGVKNNFSKILINMLNSSEQSVFYVNIDGLCLLELTTMIENFGYVRRAKRIPSNLILYSYEPLADDALNALTAYKVEYLYCGDINNVSLATLMNIKRMTSATPICAIDLSHSSWFDEAIWAMYYKNRLLFYNGDKIDDPSILMAFLRYNRDNLKDIVNFQTLVYLIMGKKTTKSYKQNALFYCKGLDVYDYEHNLLGSLDKKSFYSFMPKDTQPEVPEECKQCHLGAICSNFNINLSDIMALKNCELLKEMASLAMYEEDRKLEEFEKIKNEQD